MSINATLMHPEQRRNFLADQVDFFLGETWRSDFLRMVACCKTADALGKWQVFSPIPRDVQDARRATAAAYALGHLPLVPWDIYMGSDATGVRPRYFGKPEEYGDLYKFVRAYPELFDGCEAPASAAVVVNTDKFLADAVAQVCRTLLANHVPFAFAPAGREVYDCPLAEERLARFDVVVRVNPPEDFAPADRAALEALAQKTLLATPADLTPEFLAPLSLFTYWGPEGVYLLPRTPVAGTSDRLLVHLLNFNKRPEDGRPVALKWTSLLLRRPALLGPRLVRARWYAPGVEPATLETETLATGIRVLLPRLDLWGVAELEFGGGGEASRRP